jgi:hypothetical protein
LRGEEMLQRLTEILRKPGTLDFFHQALLKSLGSGGNFRREV